MALIGTVVLNGWRRILAVLCLVLLLPLSFAFSQPHIETEDVQGLWRNSALEDYLTGMHDVIALMSAEIEQDLTGMTYAIAACDKSKYLGHLQGLIRIATEAARIRREANLFWAQLDPMVKRLNQLQPIYQRAVEMGDQTNEAREKLNNSSKSLSAALAWQALAEATWEKALGVRNAAQKAIATKPSYPVDCQPAYTTDPPETDDVPVVTPVDPLPPQENLEIEAWRILAKDAFDLMQETADRCDRLHFDDAARRFTIARIRLANLLARYAHIAGNFPNTEDGVAALANQAIAKVALAEVLALEATLPTFPKNCLQRAFRITRNVQFTSQGGDYGAIAVTTETGDLQITVIIAQAGDGSWMGSGTYDLNGTHHVRVTDPVYEGTDRYHTVLAFDIQIEVSNDTLMFETPERVDVVMIGPLDYGYIGKNQFRLFQEDVWTFNMNVASLEHNPVSRKSTEHEWPLEPNAYSRLENNISTMVEALPTDQAFDLLMAR